MTALLEVNQIVRTYPGVRAVDGVSFQIRRGQCFGLLGPNGAGKTTTLEILEGIEKPTSGQVLYHGKTLGSAYHEVIGVLFQDTALQDFQTVAESLGMFSSLYRRRADRDGLIRMCNLEDILDRDTRDLSGGQRQRLLLAIALINDPELLFLDEPTTGLDPQARRNFWGMIETVRRQGKTVVLTTHDMDEAERLCDEVAIIDAGRIVAQGPPDHLIREHFPLNIIRLPASAWPKNVSLPQASTIRDSGLEIFVEDVTPMLRHMEESRADLTEMRVDAPTLEDVFLKLTGHSLRS
jgi:ABC-2 type transport system ATP-binding protein